MSDKLYRFVPEPGYRGKPMTEALDSFEDSIGTWVEVVIDYAALALVLDDIFHGNEQHHSATDVMNAALEGTDDG